MVGWESTASRSMVAGIFAIRTRREPASRGKFPVHRKTWSRATHLPATRKKSSTDRLRERPSALSQSESQFRRKTRTRGSVELRKKWDVKNRCERPIGNSGRLARRWRFSISSKRSVSSAMTARLATIGLSGFIPLNPAHGQPHDEARFAGFRFDFDFTIFRSPTMHWLIVRPRPFPDPTPLVGKNGSKMCVIEQCADRQPQRDPSHRIAKTIQWKVVHVAKPAYAFQSRADVHQGRSSARQSRHFLAARRRARLPNRSARSSACACSPTGSPKHHPQNRSTGSQWSGPSVWCSRWATS